jgi:hypothetical protein
MIYLHSYRKSRIAHVFYGCNKHVYTVEVREHGVIIYRIIDEDYMVDVEKFEYELPETLNIKNIDDHILLLSTEDIRKDVSDSILRIALNNLDISII